MSGIDIALWDLKGRRLGVPTYQLLGGRVRNKVQVYAWIGGDRPSEVEAAALVPSLHVYSSSTGIDTDAVKPVSLRASSVSR